MEESIEYLSRQFELPELELQQYSPLTLAYIGDAAYELIIRTVLVRRGNAPVNKLHRRASSLVKAEKQSSMVRVLEPKFTEEEEKVYKSFWKRLYIKAFDWIQNTLFKESVGIYDKTNKEMLNKYKSKNTPDGEIRFLAANPDMKVKGVGTLLLHELKKREKGKEIYLFTDDKCTYQFYEHRGFERVGEKDIEMDMNKKKIPLKCLLYRKKIN